MAGIQLSGLASGMDTDAVISQLMSLERQPRVRMELRQAATQSRQDALRDISTKLAALRTAALDLKSVTTWADTQTVSSSDATKVAAKRTSGAAPGGTTITVNNLASSAQRTFTFTEQAAASTVTIGAKTIDLAAGAKLADAVAAINGGDAGVYAIDVGGKLVLAAKTTGVASAFTASGAALAEDAGAAKAGVDASITIGSTTTAHASNVITSAIPGVELTLKSPGTVTVDVGAPAPEAATIEAKVKSFVEAYNATVDFVRGKLAEKRVPNAATLADARKGALFNDTNLNGVLRTLREVAGSGLASIGVTTAAAAGTTGADALAGKLTFDATKLTAALSAGASTVKATMESFATSLDGTIAPWTQAGGVLAGRIDAAAGEVTRFKDSLVRFDERLERRETQLRKQFTALEMALSRSNSVAADLVARLGQTSS